MKVTGSQPFGLLIFKWEILGFFAWCINVKIAFLVGCPFSPSNQKTRFFSVPCSSMRWILHFSVGCPFCPLIENRNFRSKDFRPDDKIPCYKCIFGRLPIRSVNRKDKLLELKIFGLMTKLHVKIVFFGRLPVQPVAV